MKLARIGSSGRTWAPNDMSGTGAAKAPGRWNREGEFVIYAAPTLAMAVLETAAHVDDTGLPLDKFVVNIDVPDDLWAARTIKTPADLPGGWDAIPYGIVSIEVGSAWYGEGGSALIELPSVIVPEESIVLINAQHAEAPRITATATRRFQYNALFRAGAVD